MPDSNLNQPSWYDYEAMDPQGQEIKGKLSGVNETCVQSTLRAQGYFVTKISKEIEYYDEHGKLPYNPKQQGLISKTVSSVFYYPRLITASILMMFASLFKILTILVAPKSHKQGFLDSI